MAILWRMVSSKSRRQFPLFFTYVIYELATWVLGQFLYQQIPARQYFYVFSACAIVGAALSFAVIYEIFGSVFRPYEALRDFAGVIFRWAALVLLMVAALQAFSTHGNGSHRMVVALVILERSVSVIASGLLLFLLLFSQKLGVSCRQQTFGIALGFGFNYTVEAFLWTVHLVTTCPAETLNVWSSVALNIWMMIWAYYTFASERAAITAETFAPKLILERWNQVLRGVSRPAPQGAFMPNLEKIVDDVLAHQPQGGTVH
jgi:hypothetical protein